MRKAFLVLVIALILVVPFSYASENRFFTFYGGLFNRLLSLTGLAGSGSCNYNSVCDAGETVLSCPSDCGSSCDQDRDSYRRIATGCPPPAYGVDPDCDDTRANVYPGAPEICDGRDNDCDGRIDEGGVCGGHQYCFDNDFDDYDATGIPGCSTGNDCNDNNENIHPGASEVCTNSVDDNCNGLTDSADPACASPPPPSPPPPTPQQCTDHDGDNYSPTPGQNNCLIGHPSVDCNDNNPAINPIATEIRGNGIDEDCSGADAPAAQTSNSRDNDHDGKLVTAGDCDDSDPTVYTGAPEICNDGIDNDCDGDIDGGVRESGEAELFPGLGTLGRPDRDCDLCGNGECDPNDGVICPDDCGQLQGQTEPESQAPAEPTLTPDQVEGIKRNLIVAGSNANKIKELLKSHYELTGDPAVNSVLELTDGLEITIGRFEKELENSVYSIQNAVDETNSINQAYGGVESSLKTLFPQQEG